MYPQFDYGSLYGGYGGFSPYQGYGFGGFNPYQSFGAYNPMQYMGMPGLFGGFNPYDDLFSSFQTKLDDLFKNYQTQLDQNVAQTAPVPSEAATAPATTEAAAPAGKQVDWNKKTSKYGSQAEKQAAYDKIMADPNASAEAKAMAEKGNVYGATQIPKVPTKTENSALVSQIQDMIPMQSKMLSQIQGLNTKTNPALSFDNPAVADMKKRLLEQQSTATPAGKLKQKIGLRGQVINPMRAGTNMQNLSYMPQGTPINNVSDFNSLFGNTTVAKNPNAIKPNTKYKQGLAGR